MTEAVKKALISQNIEVVYVTPRLVAPFDAVT